MGAHDNNSATLSYAKIPSGTDIPAQNCTCWPGFVERILPANLVIRNLKCDVDASPPPPRESKSGPAYKTTNYDLS